MNQDNRKSFTKAEALPPIDPRFDVSQVATRGHVLAARVQRVTTMFFLPALAVAVIAGYALYRGGLVRSEPSQPPAFLQRALSYDPETYFDLGGGLRGGPLVAWMGDYRPTPESLSVAAYDDLAAALRTDLTKHGTDANAWETVNGLKTLPMVTRPERVMAEFSTRLKDGIIAVPEHESLITVIGYVDGRWALSQYQDGQCVGLIGPVPKGCDNSTRDDGSFDGQMISALDRLKPTEKE